MEYTTTESLRLLEYTTNDKRVVVEKEVFDLFGQYCKMQIQTGGDRQIAISFNTHQNSAHVFMLFKNKHSSTYISSVNKLRLNV